MKKIFNCEQKLTGGGKIAYRNLLTALFSLALVSSATLTSCSNQEEDVPVDNPTRLAISVGLNQPQSRAIITGNALPDNHVIGVRLDDAETTDYDAYTNVPFTASTVEGKQVWTPGTDVLLSATKGTVYAYSPYVQDTDMSAIPVDVTPADQTDYLYAVPVSNVNERNATAALTMNHMLANVNVKLVRGTYVGDGNVSNITIQSDGIATGGTFNAAQATPAFTAYTGTGDALSRSATTTLGGAAADVMVVPNTASAAVTFTVTVDDVDYTVSSPAVLLESGNSYEYTLSLNSTFLAVSSVNVTTWNPVTKESLTLEKLNPWDVLENGIYAVAADGSPVTYANADESCIAVALVVGEHKFWIEKNGEANTTSIKAAYTADGASNTNYKYFYWGMYGTDNTSITNYTQTGGGGTSSNGYLPQANGSYTSSPNLSGDYTTWTSGALSDFNGKANTAALLAASDTDSDNTYANMATWCRIFNQTATENQGYTDWYIPACGQLSLMYLNLSAINNALTKIGGQTIASYAYWSSSECSSDSGWFVHFINGRVDSYGKNVYSRVRLVRDIE